MKFSMLFLTLSLFSMSAFSAISNWKLVSQKNGITVSKTQMKGSKVVGFKGETIIYNSAEKVFSVLLNNSHRKDWVNRLKVSKILKRITKNEYVIYQEFKLPWPLSNRDFIYRGKATRDAKSGKVFLKMSSLDWPTGPKTVGVRAELKKSLYTLTPMGPNRTKVEVEILSDPKGLIPKWVVNLIQKSWPHKTLTAIKKQVEKSFVKPLALPVPTVL